MTSKTLRKPNSTTPLKKNFFNNFILKKKSWEYILLSTFKEKNGVFCIFKVNKWAKLSVFAPFSKVPGGLEGLFDFYDSLHHHPQAGHSPRK
jgi:hypothetical protein